VDNSELGRPSTWLGALGLGLAVPAARALADINAGHALWPLLPFYIALGLSVFGAALAIAHGFWGLLAFVVTVAEAVRAFQAQPPAPAEPDDQPDDDQDPDPDDAAQAAMRLAVEIWFRAGEGLGSFSENSMTGAGVCGSDTWPRLAGFYTAPAGHQVLRVVPGNVGTTWNHGHNLDGTLLGLASGRIPLPPGDVPDVKPLITVATRRGAAQRSATKPKPAVVDVPPSREGLEHG
jgi:hypothetical protein